MKKVWADFVAKCNFFFSLISHCALFVPVWDLQPALNVLLLPLQDTDAAYMAKLELEAKVDELSDEVEFLRQLYDAVSNCTDP